MARFRHRFPVKAPLRLVWALHEDPSALPALTPPPLRVRLLEKSDPLGAGGLLSFRMFLIEPFGTTWHATYDEYTPYQREKLECGFVDRALKGPFHAWTHRHTFEAVDADTSTITDDARFALIGGPLGEVVSWLIGYPAVALLFAYRRFQTGRLLRRMVEAERAGGAPTR